MKPIVISLGGGLMVPDKLDLPFLKNFRDFILDLVKEGKRFVIICGGGQTCRTYRDAARELGKATQEDLDWVGIYSTKLNAELLRTIFSGHCHPRVIEPDKPPETLEKPILIASGWKPGRSTDYGTVLLAKHFGAKEVYNLTNVDYVYDKDPKKSKDLKPFPNLTWEEFNRFTPSDWSPGLYTPFDPVAATLAKNSNMKVIIINGRNIPNLRDCFDAKPFKGTVIGD